MKIGSDISEIHRVVQAVSHRDTFPYRRRLPNKNHLKASESDRDE
jgi:phosphopantetheinyl transferase (holo-ACP synthase)